MNDPKLNELLKWSINNSEFTQARDAPASGVNMNQDRGRGLNSEAMAQLLGGPSDADRMREAMAAIQSPEVDLENKLTAFDNLEQLIENIDNANNMESLRLWMPLIEQLENTESELRRFAAWCVGTAVQNNPKAQDRCLAIGAIPKLVKLALEDSSQAVRKKAVLGLSSEVRNYQPGLDELVKHLPDQFKREGRVDANDMDAVDSVIDQLREAVSQMP